jgi:hypothetical protein
MEHTAGIHDRGIYGMGKVGKQAFKLRSSSHWRLPRKHHCHILNQSLQSTPAAAPIPAPAPAPVVPVPAHISASASEPLSVTVAQA